MLVLEIKPFSDSVLKASSDGTTTEQISDDQYGNSAQC